MKKRIAILFIAILLIPATSGLAGGDTASSYTYLDTRRPPEALSARTLTDDEAAGLAGASLDVLKKRISTFADFSAWVRLALVPNLDFTPIVTSNDLMQFTFGAEFSHSWLLSWFSPNMTASIAQFVLEDDHPGIKTVFILTKNGSDLTMRCANLIPAESGGCYIVNAEHFAGISRTRLMDSCAMDQQLFVPDPEELITYFRERHAKEHLTQILLLDSADTIVLDRGEGVYVGRSTEHLTIVYQDRDAKYPAPGSAPKLGNLGFPKQLKTGSEIDLETARALEKGTYEDAAAAIRTIPDVLHYLYYTGYSSYGFDSTVEMHDGVWHYNLKPGVVFTRGKGNCGGTSALIAGLLDGDYDEVGMITLRLPSDGHVVDYVKDGALYYIFYGVNWVATGYKGTGLTFCYGKTLEEAAAKYAKVTGATMMAAYTNEDGGDCPVIFSENGMILPNNFGSDLRILKETPDKGCMFSLIEADPEILDAIDVIRNVW